MAELLQLAKAPKNGKIRFLGAFNYNDFVAVQAVPFAKPR